MNDAIKKIQKQRRDDLIVRNKTVADIVNNIETLKAKLKREEELLQLIHRHYQIVIDEYNDEINAILKEKGLI